MTRGLIQYLMIAIVGLGLVSVPAFSADVTGKTSTQTLPTQTNTQTAPLPSNTQTVPLPSTTREYQQVDKPPVKTLDIPDYDLAGDLKILSVHEWMGGEMIHIDYKVALINKGKRNITSSTNSVLIRVRLINVLNQIEIYTESYYWDGPAIKQDYWTLQKTEGTAAFYKDRDGAPRTINNIKMIVDIDPNNRFGEAQRFRGNNRCIATW